MDTAIHFPPSSTLLWGFNCSSTSLPIAVALPRAIEEGRNPLGVLWLWLFFSMSLKVSILFLFMSWCQRVHLIFRSTRLLTWALERAGWEILCQWIFFFLISFSIFVFLILLFDVIIGWYELSRDWSDSETADWGSRWEAIYPHPCRASWQNPAQGHGQWP